jgi:predicted nucleic acid-binding protein
MVVLDANILIRAVLGQRVRAILETHFDKTTFLAPDTAFAEAREHLPGILRKRGINPESALAVLDELMGIIECVDADIYVPLERTARRRLRARDEDDWPVLATALALESPIWTEDADFFGTGVATWTTDRVELLLSEAGPDAGEPLAQRE